MRSRSRAALPLAFLGVALTLALAPSPASGFARSAPSDPWGINGQFLFNDIPKTDWPMHLRAIAASGITLVRDYTRWHVVEPNPPVGGRHDYRWTVTDEIVTALAQHNLRWLPTIGFSSDWAAPEEGAWKRPPADRDAYATFAAAVAARYGRNGEFWRANPELPQLPVGDFEIWNEPNNDVHWAPGREPDRYVDMYLAAREAIRRVDPGASVWVGGLEGIAAPDFIRAMYAHRPDARGRIDALGLHPYAGTPQVVVGLVQAARATLDGLGEIDVPIAITEVGWSTRSTGSSFATDETRARYFASLADALPRSDCGVDNFTPHTWVTVERNVFNSEHWFGIFHPNGAPTATSQAYASTIHELNAQGALQRGADLALCGRVPDLVLGARRASVARRGGTATQVRRRSRCHTARVTLAAVPLEGATVRFAYAEGRTGRRDISRKTNASGVAAMCRKRSRRRRAALRLLEATASRADLAHVAVAASGRLRLP